MRNRMILLGILAVGLFGSHTLAFSDTSGIDPRDVALDKALGGMEEGSRILSPHGDIHAEGQRMHGTPGSHVGSAAETHHPAASATAPPGPFPAATGVNHGVFVHGSSGSETGLAGSSPEGTGANIGIETETLPGGNERSIIEVGADANLNTDNPSASGGEHSIIEANAGADLSGGSPTVETEVTIDPNASGSLVDAGATTSTDVIEQELTSNTGLQVDVGTDTTTAETTTVATETGSTDVSATNEVTGGAEADVDGAGAGDDIGCGATEAEGLLCPTTTTPKL